MAHAPRDPLAHPEVQLASARGYVLAAAVAACLMLAALWTAETGGPSPAGIDAALGVLALLAVAVQLRYLFELGFSPARRWHTVALAFSVPLFALAVGLTAWMFHGLMARTMLHALGM